MTENDPQKVEAFTQLMMANRGRLFGFIFTLVHDRNATEEILQEASIVLWRKFDQFESGSDFGAWAMKVSRFAVFEWRRRQARLPLQMDDELLESLAAEAMEASCDSEVQIEALEGCVDKLSQKDRELLAERYQEETSVSNIADVSGRSRMAVYKVLSRIHRDLLNCVEKQLTLQGGLS
ncbi:MAG: sigma-70 family RNA polymerase sigma factor [Verrucomicrobiota bacterium]